MRHRRRYTPECSKEYGNPTDSCSGSINRPESFFGKCGSAAGLPGNLQDQVLSRLRGHKSSRLTRGSHDKDLYNLRQDFPTMRSRIPRLHKILSARKPRSRGELWRDKRDSAGWDTYCTVLIFVAVTILLSFLQVVLRMAQLARQ